MHSATIFYFNSQTSSIIVIKNILPLYLGASVMKANEPTKKTSPQGEDLGILVRQV